MFIVAAMAFATLFKSCLENCGMNPKPKLRDIYCKPQKTLARRLKIQHPNPPKPRTPVKHPKPATLKPRSEIELLKEPLEPLKEPVRILEDLESGRKADPDTHIQKKNGFGFQVDVSTWSLSEAARSPPPPPGRAKSPLGKIYKARRGHQRFAIGNGGESHKPEKKGVACLGAGSLCKLTALGKKKQNTFIIVLW